VNQDSPSYVAVDLGAGSGRVIVGRFGQERLELEELHRFPNPVARSGGHERWNTAGLFAEILDGLAKLPDRGRGVASVGVDAWAVDYGLFDGAGRLLEEPICYRDERTRGMPERVFEVVSREEIFARTGIATQPFNTIFQLFAHRNDGSWPREAERLLMMPDIFHSFLCGAVVGERTNASTTQMLALDSGEWDRELCRRLDLPDSILPAVVAPGTRLGKLSPELAHRLGLPPIDIVAPATHDTGSAVTGAPLEEGWVYISSGTWSLVGIETPLPIVTAEALAENFTNERGFGGSFRFLKNVMGLWILEECIRVWGKAGSDFSHEEVSRGVSSAPPFSGFVFPDDPRFFHPTDMTQAVRGFLQETGRPVAADPFALARIILESLALRCASVLASVQKLTGRIVRGIRVVGGGGLNDFLNQAIANATGLEVLAGPAEATAVGNLLAQAIAGGRFADLSEGREFLARTLPSKRFLPKDHEAWTRAAAAYARCTGDDGGKFG
jgi:rhamnulokinase